MDNIMLFNPNTNEISSKQTPIEIALGVDENGMTTARKLYEFLELNPSNYSKWCKTNITENQFAIENEDYTRFVLEYESAVGIKEREDYRLTAHFAKKLSCKGNSAKAELAREYFTRFEEKAKEDVIDRQQLSPLMQSLMSMVEVQAKQELEQKRQAEQLNRIEKQQEVIKQAIQPVTENWKEEIGKKIRRIQYSCGRDFRELTAEMYKELEQRANCNLSARLRNKRQRMEEAGCTKTAINNARKIDIIEEIPQLRLIFEKIVSEYVIRYCA